MRSIMTKLLMLFLCCLAAPAWGDGGSGTKVVSPTACSSYMGKATINELRIGNSGKSSASNQIEIFNSGNVAQSIWQNWQLLVYYKSGNTVSKKGGYFLSSGFIANGQFIYNNSKSLYLRNRNSRSVDVALIDSGGKLIDYVVIEGGIQTPPSCFSASSPVNAVSASDSSGDVPRLPDGGPWPSQVASTSGNTISHSNMCSVGSDLVVSNSADSLTPIVNNTTVNFTVTVTNKSCSTALSNVAITDMGVTASALFGLSYSVSQGSVSKNSGSLGWSLGTLAAGASATLSASGKPTTVGTLTSTAAINTPSSGLINTQDDSSSVSLLVRDYNYVDFDIGSDTITEGDTTSYSASISASQIPSKLVTVTYTVSGTGKAYTDLPASGSVTIDPSSSDSPDQTSIDFNITNDNVVEAPRSIVLTITGVTSSDGMVKLGPSNPMAITLLDDDVLPSDAYSMDQAGWTGASGEVADSAGSKNGTAVGGATTAAGKVCNGGSFDGRTGYINANGISSVLNGTASLSFWIKTTQSGSDTDWQAPGVTGVEQSGGTNDIFWGWLDASGHIGISVGDDNSAKSQTAINDGTWHQVVLTRDSATGAYKIYIDGDLDQAGQTGSGTVSTTYSSIGRIEDTGGTPEYFSGMLDELKIFNTVLNDVQVQKIYNNESAGMNWDGSTRTCVIAATGPAALNAVDVGTNAVSGRIGTKIAATGFSLDLYALNATRTAQDTTFSGTVQVDLLANTGVGVSLDSQNCPTSGTSLAVGTASLSGGKATLAVPAVADAWRDVRARMKYSGPPALTACSTDNFAVKPASLSIQASDGNWTTAGTARILNATGASGSPTHKAGRPFTLMASAYNAAGVLTGNYNGAPVAVGAAALSPASVLGAFVTGSFSGSGTLQSTTASYNDVGSFSTQFQDAGFASVDAGDTAASCAGYYVCSGSVTLGRFVPDHLVVSAASSSPACGSFTYYGQDGLGTGFTLSAQDANNNTTLNYAGSLARLDPTNYAALGFTATGLPTGVSFGSGATAPSGAWSGGIAGSVRATHLLSRPASGTPPSPASISLFAAPADLDGVTVANAAALGNATEFRYGRVRLANAYGSELLDLAMNLKSEYWTGSGWIFNGGDTCTDATIALAAAGKSDITARTCVRDGLATSGRACSGTPPATKQFREAGVSGYAGDFNLWLKAPGIPGSVDVTAGVPAWLQYNWSGVVGNPKGRATFGVFKSGPIIYMRENF
jgi:hypothetical protein